MGLWTTQSRAPGVAELTWSIEDRWWLDPQAPPALADYLASAFAEGVHRVEAQVPTDDRELRHALQRAGMRPEGVSRGRLHDADGTPSDALRLARLADDPALGTREAFLGMLNATLPTKRVIAQGLIRNHTGDILMCELTYKREWDLPGGVVDPSESPAGALSREIKEELGVQVSVGALLAVDWLPPYRQWDDALLLVFDLGFHPDLPERARLQPNEIAAVRWCGVRDIDAHAAPYVVRLLTTIVAADPPADVTAYLEDGIAVHGTG